MAKRITPEQRQEVIALLQRGEDRQTIAARVGVTPGQVSAVSAHVTMGSYEGLAPTDDASVSAVSAECTDSPILEVSETTTNILDVLRRQSDTKPPQLESDFDPVPLGTDAETDETIYWNPDPSRGSANPHVLVLGESGFGKTYSICCLVSELAQRGVTSIVFDYGQGFSLESAPTEFLENVRPVEIEASRDGININPLQPFPSDLHGPINVAQRIADTFQRVYPRLGIQQHAILRQAVLDSMRQAGIAADDPSTWGNDLPAFSSIRKILDEYASDSQNPHRRQAAEVGSHVSTVFVFNTFRTSGRTLSWVDLMNEGGVFIIQLRGLEHSLERIVTEFLLWNFIGFVESLGPGPLRTFAVLDEAHKLAFDTGSPVEKLLREGRKYGLGLILASQQPEDFSPVAFSNTATKLVFQVGDERSTVSRQIHRKLRNEHTFNDVLEIITKLPRGWTYAVTENVGRVVQITSLADRRKSPHS